MEIKKKQIKYNYSLRLDRIKYIVIHDTGNQGRGANTDSHFNYFNGGDRGASANIFVDDNKALETVDCKYAAWHCGDGYGRYGITNHNSIGIEICVNSDGDYNKAFENAIDVTKQLMIKYGISASNVVRHYDVSRKCCPRSMSDYNWRKWNEFKDLILRKGSTSNSAVNSGGDYSVKDKIGITTDCLNVRSGPGTSYGKIGELNKGEKVKIFKRTGDWYEIYYGNSGGYVSGNYIEIDMYDSKPDGNDVRDKIGIVITDVLNVRYTPNGKIIGQIKKGKKVKLWRKEGEWYHIYSPIEGYNQAYVYKDYIKIEGNCGSSSRARYLNLHPHMISWAVYPLNVAPVRENQCGNLSPASCKGLSYIIEGNPQRDVYIITTSSFGKVQIYAPTDNDSTISEKSLY